MLTQEKTIIGKTHRQQVVLSATVIGEGQQEKINNSEKVSDIKVNVRRMGQAAEKVIIYIKYHL